jgi:sulfoquinovosidase
MKLSPTPDGWTLADDSGQIIVSQSSSRPCCFVGQGHAEVDMYRGNFSFRDHLEERVALRESWIETVGDGSRIHLARAKGMSPEVTLSVVPTAAGTRLDVRGHAPGINRLWFRISAQPGEHVWGCGEQMSYFDLRGRNFPLWTSEPGVGRDKSTYVTWQADVNGKAGGDYYTTNYPQPTFVSSRKFCIHAETTAYADFDFRNPDYHELQFWAVPEAIEILCGGTFRDLVSRISERFGRQPALPSWVTKGAILGLKDGPRHAERVLEQSLKAGIPVTALWCEDWAGIRRTSFGKRLFWDWQWNPSQYPDHQAWVAALNARGIRFMGYANPYLCDDGALYKEASARGYFAKNAEGKDYLVDFGEFRGGVVDFTNPEAARWFSEHVIRKGMVESGLDGWMADFGEYLPVDVRLASGQDPMLMHNAWPTLWAKVNQDAVAAAGRTGEVIFFMRAGYTGVQRYCPMVWAGDQSVDFSRHDGLQTVICGALSSGLMGNAYHHSDIGGYTSLYGTKRTPELFQRWAEMAAFTPMMRTHEGNRPSENFQFWQDQGVMAHFARMARIFVALGFYTRRLSEEAVATGLPLQRPLFLHHESDPEAYAIQDEYLYGEDLLVAPVHQAGRDSWEPYLPRGARWVHLWTGKEFEGGARVKVPAPLGQPPVFVRRGASSEKALLALAAS